ncbi:MAG: FTR1 family protein [Promethearchaeota archaeon]
MLAEFVITFRETLEAALVVGIVLGVLRRTGDYDARPAVYWAVVAGVGASALAAYAFDAFAGGFEGAAEQVFEGVLSLAGAALLTTMVVWLMGRGNLAAELEEKVERQLVKPSRAGLFGLVFASVLREGVETVVFLGAASAVAGGTSVLGGLLGVVVAATLGVAIFATTRRVNLKALFRATGVVLIIFAAGLVAYAVHELQEAGVVPTVLHPLWNLNPALDENGTIGSLLKGLFGYDGDPSLLEVSAWGTYLVAAGLAWRHSSRARSKVAVAAAAAARTTGDS